MKISQIISDLKYKKVNVFVRILSINTCKCYIYYTYKMNIKTNLIEEYVNFVDNTKKRNKNLWICIIMLLFILVVLTFIIFVIRSIS